MSSNEQLRKMNKYVKDTIRLGRTVDIQPTSATNEEHARNARRILLEQRVRLQETSRGENIWG